MITQQLGFSLEEIRSMLEGLPNQRTPTAKDWAKISVKLQERIDEQIAQLSVMRERLGGCIGCGCLSLEACALYNREDRAGSKGAGPRYLLGDEPG